MSYELQEIRPKIFLLSFDDRYKMAMTFLRYAEYYENPVWKGKIFTIIDFMEWYSKKYGKGVFTYPNDWSGFNIPGKSLVNFPWESIKDPNKYDSFMRYIVADIEYKHGRNFYLIGAEKGKEDTIQHEVAHGFYASNWVYQDQMYYLVDNVLSEEHLSLMKEWLKENMYHEDVWYDEIQAYFATGLTRDQKSMFRMNKLSTKREEKEFRKVFKVFYNEKQDQRSNNTKILERSRTSA